MLLAIPFFLGRSFYRALIKRKRIESEARELNFASAKVVGHTKIRDNSDGGTYEHLAIVEYETPENEVIWAETQPCDKDSSGLDSVVDIMFRPSRARSAMIIPYKEFSQNVVNFEKNIEPVLSLVGIGILCGVALHFHGFAIHIFEPLVAMLCAGFAFGHLTKGRNTREERQDAAHYQRMCDRLIPAQESGVIPCQLSE